VCVFGFLHFEILNDNSEELLGLYYYLKLFPIQKKLNFVVILNIKTVVGQIMGPPGVYFPNVSLANHLASHLQHPHKQTTQNLQFKAASPP
jgi:hypothetical protein